MQMKPEQAWERLRASRSNRPGRASRGARAKTYSTALEQAQQMFRAAAGVGPQTSPLLIFYGLSQAGRAIAAAAVGLKSEDWNLVAHGIKTSGLDKHFADIELRTDTVGSAGSFVRLSALLQSSVWGKVGVRLEDIWDVLPVNVDYPLTDRARLTPLYVAGDWYDGEHPLLSVAVHEFPDRVVDDGSRAALDEFLQHYPGTDGFADIVRRGAEPDSAPRFERERPGGGVLTMHWTMPVQPGTREQRRARLDSMARDYAGHDYFFPAVGGLPDTMHPLMAWWAVLYALSMLARYQPAQWAGLINVDSSPHTVPIERLLDQAMVHLPVLIADTIEAVSTWT